MSQLAQKPSDPALSLRLHNTTQQAHMYIESPAHKYQFVPYTLSLSRNASHLYICLKVKQVNLLPVTAIQGQDIPCLRERETG